MKTRRKTHKTGDNGTDPKSMSPRPEDSPVSSPRTRSPVKGVRTGGVSCAEPDALSMLNMLAEVASVTLHTDPSVTSTTQTCRVKGSSTTSRRPVDYDLLTLDHVSGMTENLLLKLFAEFESNEMWKRFTYTCRMLPSACSKFFQSFGSEHKARSGMKTHLQSHIKSLLEVHKSGQSRQNYFLESIPARRRRLSQGSSSGRKRGNTGHARSSKSSGPHKTQPQVDLCIKPKADIGSKPKRVIASTKEKENEAVEINEEEKPAASDWKSIVLPPLAHEVKDMKEVVVAESKPKRKMESSQEVKVRAKKVKTTPADPSSNINDSNNNNNSNNNNPNLEPVINTDIVPLEVKKETKRPPTQLAVSHDHGYLRASPKKTEATEEKKDTDIESEHLSQESHCRQDSAASPQVTMDRGGLGGSTGNGVDESIRCLQVKEQSLPEDHSTLLQQHMNKELLQGGVMAQGCGSSGTPLPVVGCEVEFKPDQQYKVIRSADLPVVYDHNNPAGEMEGMAKVIERDEYKVRKKPKGRAKFIGQSKAEKEMALKLINEIRSQSVMGLDTLECKICDPPRLFTAPSTLLSHYRSHAGIRPYECRICEAVFTRQHSLNYHMLIHTNQTRFTCNDCGRKFRHPSHFKEHRRRHTGESPYECSDCLMRFKTRNTYKRHLRTRHGKLLTTQGTIIILSQEEADRMKKSQGRKPRRPRQPLKIISPEAAAQMEEEQVWTDFEEGDREEEEEEEEEEEGARYSEAPRFSKQQGEAVGYQVFSDAVVVSSGMQQVNNGKTGLLKSKKVLSDNGKSNNVNCVEQQLKENTMQNTNRVFSQEIVEEEVVMDGVGDLRTYIFQPPLECNTLPKVNIRSSWNTINIDLQCLELASELTISEEGTLIDGKIVHPLNEVKNEVISVDTGCRELVGDHIGTGEVITICSGVDNGAEVAYALDNPHQHLYNTNNLDWLNVKKPIRVYGRPNSGSGNRQDSLPDKSCGQEEVAMNNNNGHDTNACGAILQQLGQDHFDYLPVNKSLICYNKPGVDTLTSASCSQGENGINASSSGDVYYVVEYDDGKEGRPASVYETTASLVPQNLSFHLNKGSEPAIVTSVPDKLVVPVPLPASCIETSKIESYAPEKQNVLTNIGSNVELETGTSKHSNKLSDSTSNLDTHNQVVNNVGGDTNKCETLISRKEPQNHSVTLQSSPSVVVTTVPHVSEAHQLSGSETELFPWSSEALPNNTKVTTYSVISPGVEESEKSKYTVTNMGENNNPTYPLVKDNTEEYEDVVDGLLMDNVEIVDGINIREEVVVIAGCVDESTTALLNGVPDQ